MFLLASICFDRQRTTVEMSVVASSFFLRRTVTLDKSPTPMVAIASIIQREQPA